VSIRRTRKWKRTGKRLATTLNGGTIDAGTAVIIAGTPARKATGLREGLPLEVEQFAKAWGFGRPLGEAAL
jgi:hypothetical protein